ncbi:MAG: hypothetical protein GEU26_17740 [Nitrososphaeraceae archaeon]|nr:hypothetical protein [Nitrososphaeraceae archaeon]
MFLESVFNDKLFGSLPDSSPRLSPAFSLLVSFPLSPSASRLSPRLSLFLTSSLSSVSIVFTFSSRSISLRSTSVGEISGSIKWVSALFCSKSLLIAELEVDDVS